MLVPLLSTWYKCVQQLGDMELGVQLLLEMLAHGRNYNRIDVDLLLTNTLAEVNIADDEPDAIQEDLLAVLKVRYNDCYCFSI